MTALIRRFIGGIVLFLMGMVLLADGLKPFAGDALRRPLVRFTGTPLREKGTRSGRSRHRDGATLRRDQGDGRTMGSNMDN